MDNKDIELSPGAKATVEHLEFLGFEVESAKGPDGKVTSYCRHMQRPNLIVHDVGMGLQILSYFDTKSSGFGFQSALNEYVLDLNLRFLACSACLNKEKSLILQMFYPLPYSKQSFSNLMSGFEIDFKILLDNPKTKEFIP